MTGERDACICVLKALGAHSLCGRYKYKGRERNGSRGALRVKEAERKRSGTGDGEKKEVAQEYPQNKIEKGEKYYEKRQYLFRL